MNPDLVARDADGKVNTVRYEAVDAMLLNKFLKEHRDVRTLQTMVAQQRKEIGTLTATVKEQASRIQKVSDTLKLSRQAPQLIVSEQ